MDEDILNGWLNGKKRTFNGEVYATKKERNRAYQNSLKEKRRKADEQRKKGYRTSA